MNAKGAHFIDGCWIDSSGPSFHAINPANEEIIWKGCTANEDTVKIAVESAKRAFKDWAKLELHQRIAYLERFKNALIQSKDLIAEAISKSTGKPLWDSHQELLSMVNKIAISIEAFHERCPNQTKQLPQGIAITSHRPHGVMAVFGPFNFPGHLPNGHIIPALLAGNTVVFKPSELAPLVAEHIMKCWESTKIPSGVINMLQGGRETGIWLSENTDLNGLLFTGSWASGQRLSEHLAKAPYKILALEMGGNNPLIVGKISDYEAAAYITIQSAYLSSGQRCTCARRLILVNGEDGERFLETLIRKMQSIHVGAYNDATEPFMGPVISKSSAEYLLNVQTNLLDKGAIALVPMKRMDKGESFLSPGLLDVTQVTDKPDEEYFGPLLQVIKVDDLRQAIEEANRTKYGLTSGLLSDSREEYEIFYKAARAGIINWNTPLTGASSAAPFGGIGRSGNNRPSAYYAADYCAYPVASLISEKLEMPQKGMPGLKT